MDLFLRNVEIKVDRKRSRRDSLDTTRRGGIAPSTIAIEAAQKGFADGLGKRQNPNMAEETPTLSDLYNSLDDAPDPISVYEQILDIWVSSGDQEMVHGTALELLRLDPRNEMALAHTLAPVPERHSTYPAPLTPFATPTPRRTPSNILPEIGTTISDLERGYKALKQDASIILEELKYIQHSTLSPPSLSRAGSSKSKAQPTDTEILSNLQNIHQGKVSTVIPMAQPLSVRESTRKITASRGKEAELIAADFDSIIQYSKLQSPPLTPEAIRNRLLKRKTLLDAALPEALSSVIAAAFANAERGNLARKYENDETMLGDAISDIPAENFFVSEDNYAWDMSELASAISANGGVMRNPYSRHMFSDADIIAILAHPLGQHLRAQHEDQHRMKLGFRTKTIEWVEKLGRIMLADQSEDARPSREAMDEFLAYVITLPKREQDVINAYKVPGRDRNTGQGYDYSVGESVRDAKANTTCFHKVGDFLSQAATYLRR